MLHAEETGLSFVRVGFLACGFNNNNNNTNTTTTTTTTTNNNDNNIFFKLS